MLKNSLRRGNANAPSIVHEAMAETNPSVMKRDDRDQPLVEALRRGESDAVETLVDRYGEWIHRVAGRLLGDPRDAEEVTQDVLLIVVQKIGTFKGDAAFSSWLYRIAVNTAYGRLRSKRSRSEVSLEPMLPVFDHDGRHVEPVLDWSSQLEDPAIAAEARSALDGAIGRLAGEYRIVLLLRDVEGLSNEEVATTLGLTVAAVKSRLHRARLVLRQELAHLFPPSR
jgi:RNA polymerase sigma-70 factor (ECF subfamily)